MKVFKSLLVEKENKALENGRNGVFNNSKVLPNTTGKSQKLHPTSQNAVKGKYKIPRLGKIFKITVVV